LFWKKQAASHARQDFLNKPAAQAREQTAAAKLARKAEDDWMCMRH
jgi:hypothetical protein